MGNLILFKYWLDATLKNNKIVKRFVKEDRGSLSLETILWILGAAVIMGIIVAFIRSEGLSEIWGTAKNLINADGATNSATNGQ